jgi:signal recognition particle GTPase
MFMLPFGLLYLPGQFTLRDMYEQFQNIMKMGPFSQIMVSLGVHAHMIASIW